jgi:hypothetical protein
MKKVVMAGCPRSGTTALCTLLSHDPNVFITNEVGNFSWDGSGFKDRLASSMDKTYIKWLLDLKGIDRDDFVEKVSDDCKKYSETISKEYGLEVVGDKMPGYLDSLKDIYHENKDAYFIMTLRDVRHFVTSSTNHYANGTRTGWTFETIEEAQRFWVVQNSKMIADLGIILPKGAKVILSRYEDIGPDIDQTIKRFSDFIGYDIQVDNPRGGFEAPDRKLRKFNLSSEAQFTMDLLGY